MNPEPMNTDLERRVPTPETLGQPVFMGSRFGPAGRPGTTEIVSSQALRRERSDRLEGLTHRRNPR
jgi:hypothetical protein